MMQNMRPGITATYTLNSVVALNNAKGIGIIANSATATELKHINMVSQVESLSSDYQADLIQLINSIYNLVLTDVYIAPIVSDSDEDFSTALNMLINQSNVYIIIVLGDAFAKADFIKNALNVASLEKKEKIAVITCPEGTDVNTAATSLNHERIMLTYPKITAVDGSTDLSAGILSAFISRNTNPASNLNGEYISGEYVLSQVMSEDEINTAIANGVCVFEQIGTYTELIRGVSTKTRDENGNLNSTYRNISTIILIDSVVPIIRVAIEQRLKFLVNSKSSIDSLATQIVIILSNFKDDGILSDYDNPIINISIDDPSVLEIDLSFTVAQGINRIAITCHITV